jgi:hypothetical protein
MSEASGPNHRLKAYKNKALDTQELRRRREEEGIQLRKQKRDEHVSMHPLFFCSAKQCIGVVKNSGLASNGRDLGIQLR